MFEVGRAAFDACDDGTLYATGEPGGQKLIKVFGRMELGGQPSCGR
ncbi:MULTISPECIES: hypothetical protein [unclassified Streptomyces]|nr:MULTISPECIES: hypothetical protein [unclassified Streptomyces]WSA93930.1 hypothetical protein OIE63_21850 [Streptomyces sp. NBC_01795]WSB78355.1 hypothetical protein OHB04_22975 [Streptomyces sp. NBC_01775]WSS13441.1 hypothetical protein OG533_17260 [Streptomyces sp. NBC_01186]WSS42231.1 hypothetical protein OG220_17825 [Streptomyces sp. NBC_01187]